MLPDYPILKKEIRDIFNLYVLKKLEQYSPSVHEFPRSTLFEGEGTTIRKSTGQENPTPFMRSESSFSINLSDIPEMTIKDIITKLDEAAFELSKKLESNLFQLIQKQLDRAGQTFDNKGKPLTGKSILNIFKKLSISFDSDGKPVLPTVFLAPEMEKSFTNALKEIHEDPVLKKESDEMFRQKKEEWRAEQTSRKLVG